jgi:hypothetical protein
VARRPLRCPYRRGAGRLGRPAGAHLPGHRRRWAGHGGCGQCCGGRCGSCHRFQAGAADPAGGAPGRRPNPTRGPRTHHRAGAARGGRAGVGGACRGRGTRSARHGTLTRGGLAAGAAEGPTGTAPPGKRSKPDSYRSFFAASSSTSGSFDPKAASSREGCRWGCFTPGSPIRTYSRRSLPAEIRSAALKRAGRRFFSADFAMGADTGRQLATARSPRSCAWARSRRRCGCPRSPGFATLRLWRQPTRPWRPLAFLRLGRRCRPTGGPLSALAPSPRPPRPDSRPQRHSGPGAPCPRSPVSTQAWWPRRRRPSSRCDLDAPPTLRATNPRRARNEPAHRYSPAHATRVPAHVPGIPNEGPGRPPITRHTHAGSPPVNLRAPASAAPAGRRGRA